MLTDLTIVTHTHTDCKVLWAPYFDSYNNFFNHDKHIVLINEFSKEITCEQSLYSDITKSMIDEESLDLVEDAYKEAIRIITQDKTYFKFVSNSLLINKVLYLNDFKEYNYTRTTNMNYNDV